MVLISRVKCCIYQYQERVGYRYQERVGYRYQERVGYRYQERVGYRLLLLLFKEVGSAKLGESDIHPISPKTPASQYQPLDRKKRKGKIVEDKSRDRAA